jgi:hypothetical protein
MYVQTSGNQGHGIMPLTDYIQDKVIYSNTIHIQGPPKKCIHTLTDWYLLKCVNIFFGGPCI